MRIEKVNLISENDFSKLAVDTYGRPYQLQQQGDCLGQDTIIRLTVPEEPMGWTGPTLEEWRERPLNLQPEEYTRGDWEEHTYLRDMWWEREFYPDVQVVANDFHARGLLPEGDYVIHIWW